jgi:MFS family permease
MHSGWFMPVLQGAYFCAGVGYVVSATFLVAIAESIPELEGYGWILWLVTGVACAPASSLWDKLTHRIGTWISLLIAYFLKSLSLIILILSQDLIAVVFSALLFGASFIGIVSMVLAMVGRLYPDNPSKPMSRLTFSYGLAQIIAPAVIGYMANRYGSFESGLALTLLVVVMGMIFLTSAWVIENNKRKRLYLTA